MKKTIRISHVAFLLVALAFVVLPARLSAAWQELLVNGGFENSFTSWTQGNGIIETSVIHDGTKSAKIVSSTYFKQFSQTIPFTSGRTIKGSGYIKAAGTTGSVGLSFQFLDGAGALISEQAIGSVSGTTAYTYKESVAVVSPAGTASVRIRGFTGTNAGGTAYFDLMSLMEQTSGPSVFTGQQTVEQMTNPGFEAGFTSWMQDNATLDAANARSGGNAAKLNGASYFKQLRYRKTAVAGEVYSASLYAKCTSLTATSGISVTFLDTNLVVLKSHPLGTMRGTRTYRRYSKENMRAPAGTAHVELRMSSASGNTGGAAYFDDFSLTKNTGLPIKVVPTYESAGVTVLTTSTTAECMLYYRKTGDVAWKEAVEPYFDVKDSGDRQFRCSIVGLQSDSAYQVYGYVIDNGVVVAEGGATFSTWVSNPPVAQQLTVAQLYTGGKLNISNLHGTANGWIKITGTGVNDVSAALTLEEAVLIYNSSYLILENVSITGGHRHGFHVQYSDDIRIQNCEASGWARPANFVANGQSYETQADVQADKPINMDAGVFLNESSRVTVERCYLHDPRLSANNWDYGHPMGAQGIVVANSSFTGNHVVRYNDIIGSDILRWNDAIESSENASIDGSFARDSDIQGNMLCYGQDDAIELDGGQENVRFFDNKMVGFLCGVSVAPNLHGPSYIFRNLIARLGDGRNTNGSMVKQGGGTTYSKGCTYFFNNTLYAGGYAGLGAVGYGSDANRDMYFAVSRNNIIQGLGANTITIKDPYDVPENSFDYDNLSNGTNPTKTDYAVGQEAHGTLNAPPVFASAANDDFRLTAASPGIDAGVVIPNFSGGFLGANPDQGAIEGPSAKLFPVRPIAITADRYRIALTATAGGASGMGTVNLAVGNIGSPIAYTIKKNTSAPWINVSPASGTLSSNTNLTLTVSVNTANLTAGVRRGVFLVRLANGYSVPVVFEATIN